MYLKKRGSNEWDLEGKEQEIETREDLYRAEKESLPVETTKYVTVHERLLSEVMSEIANKHQTTRKTIISENLLKALHPHGINPIKLKMELEKLIQADMNKLEREIGMAPERVEEDIRTLRNWINCQPHLPNIEDDEENRNWLRNFLVFCKNRLEKAKHNLEHYFSCRSIVPELFTNRDPSSRELRDSVEALYLFPLPKLTPEGCRVHFFCHTNNDASVYDADAFMKRALMFLDWKIKEDVTHGDIFIFHMKHSSLAHLGKYNFATFSRFIAIVMNAYPLRIKAVHFTMAPSFVTYVISNPFITDKIKKRIKVYSGNNMRDILSEIPEDCLPKELGGTIEESLDELNRAHYKRLLDMREWFLKTENMKSDESKRPPELKANQLFGSDGSFRSLDVD